MTEDATFWFDPICPFTWRTSRWLLAVTTARGLSIDWRPMSLAILNQGKPVPEQFAEVLKASIRPQRLLYATGVRHGPQATGSLYTAIGNRFHVAHRQLDTELLVEAIAEAGLPPELLEAADDTDLDAAVRDSHQAGQARVGTESGSPILALGDGPGFFGPVVVPVPEGEAAEKLFDAVRLLTAVPQFSELKTARASLEDS
ncbi:MAG: DsbA family protein [Micromonosporaceae bacterium]|nr:DsbA family protein [Micromonosporaceae bacterium]